MIKKQIIAVCAAVAALVAVIVLYFAYFKPMIDENSAVEETPETLPGEEIGTNNRYYMYSHIERSDMESIEVTNESGTFKLVADENGNFYLDGHRGLALDDTTVSYLVTTCGSTLSKDRIAKDASDEKLEEYGLKNPAASWVVTDKSGKQYKVYVGRKLLTGGGYYCAFAGRNSVYILDNTVEYAVLKPKEAFVTPYIIFGVSNDDYYTVNNFALYRGREKFISISQIPKEEQVNADALVENVLTYPAPYTPDPETYYGLLMSFNAFKGDSTYKIGITEQDIKDCGLDEPSYTVSFDYGGNNYYFMLKEADEDNYYALSGIYGDIITLISKDNVKFVEYDLLKWLTPYVFSRNITTVSAVSVKTEKYDETFRLAHSVDEKGAAQIQVKSDSGREFRSTEETLNFRHYYGDLIALAIMDYLPEEASEGVSMKDFLSDEDNLTMRISCTTLGGEKITYDIYRYSTRRCAVSVNGRFDFCVSSDVVKRIERDTERLMNGETIELPF